MAYQPSDCCNYGMKAIVLAAGVGSRLGEITRNAPKCLLPVGGRPLLDYWFETLETVGVSEVLVNLHHHAEKVQEYLRGRSTVMRIRTLLEPQLLGSAGTIAEAWDFVENEECFFVVYADNFARIDLKRLADFFNSKGSPVLTLVVYPTVDPKRCGIVELDEEGLVRSFEEKPANPKSNLANSGIHVAGAGLRDYLPTGRPADLGHDVLPRLVGKMYGYLTDEFIQDIGTPEAYARVNELVTTQAI